MTETPKDLTTLVDELSSDAGFVQTLLESAQDKTRFYLSNQKLLGPYRDILVNHARELESLLALTAQLVWQMDMRIEAVSDVVYNGSSV